MVNSVILVGDEPKAKTVRRYRPAFVSKEDLKAIVLPEAIPTAGTYIVTLKCEGETLPESHQACLLVGFKL